MTSTEMHINLKLEIDKTDTLDSVGFEQEELDYWLNSAIKALVKTKYSGSGFNGRGAFEQNQKRIDDLRTLIREEALDITRVTSTDSKPNSYTASLSSPSLTGTYWFALGEEVDIVYQSGTTALTNANAIVTNNFYIVSGDTVTHDGDTYNPGDYFKAANTAFTGDGSVYLATSLRQGITEATADTYRDDIDNPYSEHVFENNKAKPLRLFNNDIVELITDGNYGVFKYYLRYLNEPATLVYNTTDCDLPDHTHDEVVKLAAKMILENTGNPRYRTYLNEVSGTE